MDTTKILADLRSERDRIDRAIAALEELNTGVAEAKRQRPIVQPGRKPGGRRLSAAGRRRIAEAARQRWARQKQNATTATQSSAGQRGTRTGRTLSAAARKRISEAAKKRWAQRKKAERTA